jgi:D-glycero-alpha-D-manno-heptose-7-phosphate kinase
MIISRTPNRISFFGGGTDYPIWYSKYEGQVISATINKYCYITLRFLPQFFNYKYRIRYFRTEETQTLDQINHNSVRECAKFLELEDGFELVHNADLPARSGLGSSSTFTVGLLNAIYALKNYMPTKRELAEAAIKIEQDIIKESVGSQDQVSASWGGFNHIKFSKSRIFEVNPIVCSKNSLEILQNNILLLFTGFSRNAHDVATHQIKETHSKTKELLEMQSLTMEALNLLKSESTIDEFGTLLDIQWKIKKSITSEITNTEIDEIYSVGKKNGALGGKLLGAGGGGFMIFYAPQSTHKKIQNALPDKLFVPFRFENTGSQIIYFTHE